MNAADENNNTLIPRKRVQPLPIRTPMFPPQQALSQSDRRIKSYLMFYGLSCGRRWGQRIALYLLCGGLWLAAARGATAAPPTLTNLFPAGGQRGTTVTVTCGGSFATWPVKVWAPGVEVVATADSGKLEVTIPGDLAADRIWFRLYNQEGVSIPQPFLIGSRKEINEIEPNNKLAEAQPITELDVTVNGLFKEAEVDSFAVTLNAGQTLVAALDANTRLGSPMDSILQIVSPQGIVLAENHDDLKLDPRLTFTPKTTGTYFVRLFAFPAAPDTSIRFNGGANHIYRLTLTTGPYVTHTIPLSVPGENPGMVAVSGWNLPVDTRLNVVPFGGTRFVESQEYEVLDELRRMPDARIGFAFSPDFSQATRLRFTPPAITTTAGSIDEKGVMTIPVSSSLTGCLTQKQATAEYLIPVVKGQPLVISAEARSLDLLLDPVMKLVDPAGAVIAEIDDTGATRDAAIVHTAAQDGLYRLTITDRFRKGGERCWYLLTVRLDQPDYDLAVTGDAVVVAVDKPAEMVVKIARRGTPADAIGPISLQVIGLPEGISSAAVLSEATGPTAAEVKLTLTTTGIPFSGPIRILGKAAAANDLVRSARTAARLGVAFDTIWLTGLEKPQ
jgi:hypothetical protein